MLGDVERREAAERIACAGVAFASPPSGAVVAGYYPVRGEIDCLPLLKNLAAQGYRLALPVVHDGGLLDFISWGFNEPLEPGMFNIPCPARGVRVEPGVLLMPLLAFDSRGHRLGYGAGNYDRTLQRLRARRGKDRPGVAAIGLAFDFQFAPLLPSEAHDQRLDWVLTPSGPRWLGD